MILGVDKFTIEYGLTSTTTPIMQIKTADGKTLDLKLPYHDDGKVKMEAAVNQNPYSTFYDTALANFPHTESGETSISLRPSSYQPYLHILSNDQKIADTEAYSEIEFSHGQQVSISVTLTSSSISCELVLGEIARAYLPILIIIILSTNHFTVFRTV